MEQVQAEQVRVDWEQVEQEQVEQELLFRHLKPVKTSYHCNLCCMDSTCQSILNHIMDWVINKSGPEEVFQGNAYWFYSSLGIRKMSLAHSICENLHMWNHLAGAFFCQRDNPNLSKPINILLTFIQKLAILFCPFQTNIVAKHLHNNPHLTPESMQGSLFLDFIHSLPHNLEHTLVFVIDTLDKCGNARNHSALLKVLIDAAAQALWLKVIITSRTEVCKRKE